MSRINYKVNINNEKTAKSAKFLLGNGSPLRKPVRGYNLRFNHALYWARPIFTVAEPMGYIG